MVIPQRTHSSGNNIVLAIMFDMNLLFEKYVLNHLKRAEEAKDLAVMGQQSQKFWESKSIRPDIVLKNKKHEGGTLNIVLDTKWKILQDANPSDADLKQMYAYNHYFSCSKSYLIYPNINNLEPAEGKYTLQKDSHDHYCQVAFVDVLDKDGKLNMNLGKEIFGMIRMEKKQNINTFLQSFHK